jgi:hypothetical protein
MKYKPFITLACIAACTYGIIDAKGRREIWHGLESERSAYTAPLEQKIAALREQEMQTHPPYFAVFPSIDAALQQYNNVRRELTRAEDALSAMQQGLEPMDDEILYHKRMGLGAIGLAVTSFFAMLVPIGDMVSEYYERRRERKTGSPSRTYKYPGQA